MASINQEKIKELLLAKGDKIALGVGGGAAALLLVWGVVSAASASSPSGTIKELTDGAGNITRGVAADGEDAPPLPAWVSTNAGFKPIDPTAFAARGREFEPVFKPNLLRENPQVKDVVLAQLDVIRLPYKAYDIQDDGNGNKTVGVLKDKKPDTKDLRTLQANMQAFTQSLKQRTPPRTGNRPPPGSPPRPGVGPGGTGGRGGPGGGGPGMPGGGMPGMGGGMGGGMPGMGGGGMPGMGGGMGEGGMGGPGGMGMGGAGARTDATVEYVPPDEVAKGNYVVAQSVAPLRAVMVHGLIPLREQRLEYQRALKIQPKGYDKDGKPLLDNVEPVRYAGFDVQRRVTSPNGQTTDWADYDHVDRFFSEVKARAYGFTQEQGYLGKFFKYEDQLVHPLPVVADGLYEYPRLRMEPVDKAIEEMKKAGIQPTTPSDWERRLGKPGANENPFDPRSPLAGGESGTFGGMGGMYGPGGSPDGGMSGRGGPGGPGGMGQRPPPGSGSSGDPGGRGGMGPGGSPDGGMSGRGGPGGPGGMGMMGPGGPGTALAQPDTDLLVMRFLDIDVQPGFTYEYRVRLKLRNPNYGLKAGVGRKADAALEVIEGRWRQLPESITLPLETQLYAIDPQKYQDDFKAFYDEHGKEYALKRLAEVEALDAGRRAVVQVQQWQPSVRIDGTTKREPIGTWVVADLPVAPGEYLGKRTLVELPLWSAGLMNYVLRELAGGSKVAGIRAPENQPKGWPINFRTPSVLVDFDGGRQVERVGDRNVIDDAAQELLIVRPDGKLLVRNSADDMKDQTRSDRNKMWTDWLTRVKERKGQAAAGTGMPGAPGAPGGFGRP